MALTIGVVARESKVGIETIRYYEREGLIKPPPRSASGYRQYPEDTVNRLRFINNAKELGFSLKEISSLLSLKITKRSKCKNVKKSAKEKMLEIEKKIQSLQRIHRALKNLISKCEVNEISSECPILEALENG